MKKKQLTYLMLKGLACGLMLSSQHLVGEEQAKAKSDFIKLVEATDGNIAAEKLTEESLLLQINEKTAELYQSLDPEGKALAIELASRGCNGQNECKGKNACRTEKNACMGQGECKGKTICAFSDKADAVRVAAKLMQEKREALIKKDSVKNQENGIQSKK